MIEDIAGVVKEMAKEVAPPPEDDHHATFWWKWRIAIMSASAFFGLIGVTVAAFGLVPGFDGFARASDVTVMRGEQRQHWVYQLDQQILDFRIKQCKAASSEAKELYAAKISQLELEYQNLTQRTYLLPACADL